MRADPVSSMITWSTKRSIRSHRETTMYYIFMTDTLISSQLGHLDRATVIRNAGLTESRTATHRRRSAAIFSRKKS
jgi:hypothetical protein